MFKHLLLPTDGSPASHMAVRRGLEFAQDQKARVTVLHVVPDFHALTYRTVMLEDTRERFLADCRTAGQKILDEVERQAQEMDVACTARMVRHDHPYEAIIGTATEAGCDLIVIASHGHRGLKGLVLGSETDKLLTHATTAVLVVRS